MRCRDAAWEAVRIEAGLPVNGRELVEGTIAAEVGLVERTVSFTKGCFTGQELVARLDARGSKVARHLRAVVVGPADGVRGQPDGGGPLSRVAGHVTADGEHEVGHLSSAAWSPGLGRPGGPGHPAPAGRAARSGVVAVGRRRAGRAPLAAEARALPLDV